MFENIKVPRTIIAGDPKQDFPFVYEKGDLFEVKSCRRILSDFNAYLSKCFERGYAVRSLLQCRTHFFDHMLKALFSHFALDEEESTALIAVGGYGRGEMFPGSDVDIFLRQCRIYPLRT